MRSFTIKYYIYILFYKLVCFLLQQLTEMSQILSVKLNKFECVDGSRIGSRQVLYQSNLYNKHKLISWKCKVNKCNSTLNIDEENLNVIREPSKHIDHPEVTAVRVAVLQAINKMKVAAKEETTVDLKTIYNRYLKTLTDAKFLLNDISSINDGQLLPYVEFRSKKNKVKKLVFWEWKTKVRCTLLD